MKLYDILVIGSGMGGSMIASLNKNRDLLVLEKEQNLGGCASTFKRYGSYFNAGATTFVGYEKNHIVKDIFDKAEAALDLRESKIAIRVLQNGKTIDRVKDFEQFLEKIDKAYPNKNNRIFWEKIKELDEKFWQLQKLYYAKYSFYSYLKTLNSFLELFIKFRTYSFKSAKSFIKEVLGEISKEYQNFIDSQLLITLQTTSKDLSILSMAIGLSYPFHKVFYVNEGMGELFKELLKDVEVRKKEEVLKILKEKNYFRVITSKSEYKSLNVVLNSTIYDCARFFEDKKIKEYYKKFTFSDQSAFVLNFNLNSKEEFLHHYQIILEKNIPNTVSNSFFISLSDKEDKKMSKKALSVTISTHTKALFWEDLSFDEYKTKKEETQNFIIDSFLKHFKSVKKEDIINLSSATSKTFKRYINRNNCGGSPVTLKNIFQIPSCRTPFKGLYNIGDTVFAGQGWPGVALGVKVLNEEINE
ncbi:phytoene desaturase family protein [Halarcobacter anaerophilus]|uniref:Carotene isomerase n=1 Tax=Halarcobacter anaerophilus TaxID=877500 RepID=A0A4Q0Y2V6_9BACT|nr:NAD(P)-binding protein [Halarcobacter anaerophilus]QDF29666.1 phytoene dehydrogenase-related protein [Halarcobacter anaerophilus]RXJ62591.1 carotene isomerase [Halarcobacter anaerophilus]